MDKDEEFSRLMGFPESKALVADAFKIHKGNIRPAVERAVAAHEKKAVIYALLIEALNLCRELEPHERQSHEMFTRLAAATLDLYSLPAMYRDIDY